MVSDKPYKNHLLARLRPADRSRLLEQMHLVELGFKEMLFEQGHPVKNVFFVEDGVASMVMALEEQGDMVETGTIGREGFVGLPVLFGAPVATTRCFVQVAGAAYRLPAQRFTELLPEIPELTSILLRYTNTFMTMISQSAACNRMHVVEARLARWLLMTHDRVTSDEFLLTQEFIGQMLGVRRPAVSIAGATLQRAGLVRYVRGKITVVDRKGLEEAACECYARVRAIYEMTFPA